MGPIVTALDELPAVPLDGVVLANELLDNLPFRIVERADDGWGEVRVGLDGDELVETVVPAADELAAEADLVAADACPRASALPVPDRASRAGCARARRRCAAACWWSIDYAATGAELVDRGVERVGCAPTGTTSAGGATARAPGEQDITIDVPREYLVHAAAAPASSLELDAHPGRVAARARASSDLVADAREQWDARAHVGDLEAVRHRSRVSEAAALVDPAGLGAHRVLVFTR